MTHYQFASLLLLAIAAAAAAAAGTTTASNKVSVQFYGESACPYCRKFVEETWNEIWSDEELRSYIDYDFVPWGNAYFSTTSCGSGPYNPSERACFYDKCITTASDDEKACFGGEPVYQHSVKEGQVDIYETCILEDSGLEAAVAFTYCAEGSDMDDNDMSAHEVMIECVPDGVDPTAVEECLKTRGRQLEIANAKKTPVHPGVPYVLVDGNPLDNPFDTKKIICQKLEKQGVHPKGCSAATSSQLRTQPSLSY